MEIKEAWKITIGNTEIEDVQLQEEIKKIVKGDVQDYNDEIKEAIAELSKRFVELGYTEGELASEVRYEVDARGSGYNLNLIVFVYPIYLTGVLKFRKILHNVFIHYVHDEYPKTRNEQGIALKSKVYPLYRVAQLQKENEELKKKLEKAEKIIKKLRRKLEQQRKLEEEKAGVVEVEEEAEEDP